MLRFMNATNPYYTDLTVDNKLNRQWLWLLCNEPFGFWQDGAPKDKPTLVSRLVNLGYARDQCALTFGKEFSVEAHLKSVAGVNAWTGGWSVTNTTRLMYVNGQYDPWRDSTVSSINRPGGPLQSTSEVPVYVVPGRLPLLGLLPAELGRQRGRARDRRQGDDADRRMGGRVLPREGHKAAVKGLGFHVCYGAKHGGYTGVII